MAASYLKNCWYVAGFPAEANRTPMARTILDEPVMLFRTEAGAAVAMSNRCPHRFAPLSRGKLIGDIIQCPYHGLRFNTSGQCVLMPFGDGVVPTHGAVTTYPLVERFGVLWIWMGQPEVADPALIPDYSYLERADLAWYSFYLHAKANYLLLVDNLLDLSHTEFLHPMLSSAGWCMRARHSIRREGDSIFAEYCAENDNVLPLFKQMKPSLGLQGTTLQEERWDPPSAIRLSVRYTSPEGALWVPSAHFLTPETEFGTHYFVVGGHDHDIQNETLRDIAGQMVKKTFATEDLPMIEAQQQHIGRADLMSLRPMVVQGDSAAVRARRVLSGLIRSEAGKFGTTLPSGRPSEGEQLTHAEAAS